MLEELLARYGLTPSAAAELAGVSDTAVRNWISGQHPNLGNAANIADLFSFDDAKRLLEHWGYDKAAAGLAARRTNDPNVANGWRLDTLIAEIRELRKELRQHHAEALNASKDRPHTTAHFSVTDLRLLAAYIKGDDDDPPEGDMEPVND